ncbi:putative deoxyribonuclease YcfH [bacterium BMS3Bbin04]|nr:putative deoxyribonuclease YcfH [bacterium BMS3Bbin04]
MIDTHAHLTWPTFDNSVADVVQRAKEAGIRAIIDLGTDVKSSEHSRQHAHEFDTVWFGAGIHPNDASSAAPGDLAMIGALCMDDRCVAIGEIGLDFFRDHTEPAVQEKCFRDQLELAMEIEKPVVIHDRKASSEILRVLDEVGYDGINGPGGVFHCFAGDSKMVKEVLDRGFHISFTGNITYKKSDRPEVAKLVPLNRMMLETDSPFLAPVPKRGKTNEPTNIPYIAAAIAKAHGVDIDTVASETTKTAVKFFNLPESLLRGIDE